MPIFDLFLYHSLVRFSILGVIISCQDSRESLSDLLHRSEYKDLAKVSPKQHPKLEKCVPLSRPRKGQDQSATLVRSLLRDVKETSSGGF
jgi:hypothetical protein